MKFKTYLTEARVPVKPGHVFIHSFILDSKYQDIPNGKYKITLHRSGKKMGDPLILYIDGVEQPSFSGQGGKKAAKKHALEIINNGRYKK